MNDALDDIKTSFLLPNGTVAQVGLDEEAKAALQDLFYQETLALIGEDEVTHPKLLNTNRERRARAENELKATLRAKAKAKYKGED